MTMPRPHLAVVLPPLGLANAALAVALLTAAPASAQSLPQADLEKVDRVLRQQETGEAQNGALSRHGRAQAEAPLAPVSPPDPFQPAPGGPCFQIRTIVLSGFEAFAKKPEGYRDLVGRCATAADIGEALNRVNAHYQKAGYITTRAYVPEQDLADQALDIVIIPGRIEDYVYADGTPADARLHAAFPASAGSLLNLRDLEQGLDNINAPRSAKGKFQLLPGKTPGGSVVQVLVEDQRPWHADLTVNNTGFSSTGETKAAANIGFDNPAGLNDQLGLSVSTTPFDQRGRRYSDAGSLNWSVPFGASSLGIELGASAYFFILPGINQSYPVEGRSLYAALSAEQLILRNRSGKLYAYGSLKLSGSRSYIDDQEIESQRRRMTVLSLGIRGQRDLAQGTLTFDLGARAGLSAFGAHVFDKSSVETQFRLASLNLGFEHPLARDVLTYKGALTAQISGDILPSTEQINIGGWSTVRGFHDDSMYGDTGIYLRNTLVFDAWQGDHASLALNAGFDLGYVKPSRLRNWSQDHLIGISLGADVRIGDHATLSMQIAHALSRPDENPPHANPAFEAGRTVGYLGLKTEF
uniref:ShlB/FhaC/HecB family hemolysin secretion/activation protein n=1 Tax=Agrobacterium albertimagni TaxID=147266 RepID=A0A7C1SIN9_9HYPH